MTEVTKETIIQKIMKALNNINPYCVNRLEYKPGNVVTYGLGQNLFVTKEQNKLETPHGDGSIYLIRIKSAKSSLDLTVDSQIFNRVEVIFNKYHKDQEMTNFDRSLDYVLNQITL